MAENKKNLVIVESPSKAKTIEKYLGSKYRVIASKGHVRDLPKSKLGVAIDNDFEPEYINIRGKAADIKALKKAAEESKAVYLATDPDREGEAIAWHIAYLLGIQPEEAKRIEFNEITKKTVLAAIESPRAIGQSLVDAQQARRVLDRLVGYQISPVLWHKVKKGLSAGRVQSAALKILCDREYEVNAFEPKEYWNLAAVLQPAGSKARFTAKLAEKNGKKLSVDNGKDAGAIQEELEKLPFAVASKEEKERLKKPFAPYNTSSLQQDASIRLGFTTKKTMNVAQHLYENGLITYMRTDSYRISPDAKAEALAYIEKAFGSAYCGNNVYGNKKQGVQDAHEAIRPSVPSLDPSHAKISDHDEMRLYELIWSRFMASQMTAAVYDDTLVDVAAGDYLLKAKGTSLRFNGFLTVYHVKDEEDDAKQLPALEKGDVLNLREVTAEQKFTEPPSRFTEASLVKELEERGIGRPSTYATIITTLLDHAYVSRTKKVLEPTKLGITVTKLIEESFQKSKIVDVGFTAKMEEKLDAVEEGTITDWKSVIRDFYVPFKEELDAAENDLQHVKMESEPALDDAGNPILCDKCGKPMVIRHGKFGDFIACSGFPACHNTLAMTKGTGVMCPSCGKELIVKRSRKGKVFYGCSGYPECQQVYWYKPTNKTCPKCGALLVEHHLKGTKLSCSNPECSYKE